MKFLVAFVALFLVISTHALTEEQKEKVRGHSKFCRGDTKIPDELVQKIRRGDFEFEDVRAKEYSFCMFRRAQIMTEDGKFLKDVAVAKVEPEIREKVGKAIDNCVEKVGATHAETAWNYAKCYHKERPDHDVV